MIAAIYGDTNDTWIITTLLHGLEEWIKGFGSDELVIVTDNKTVKAMAEARSRVAEVLPRANGTPPQALFIINGGFPQARIEERARKLRIPVYKINGG